MMSAANQGKLADKPVAELIRELNESSATGALRLSRDRAKAVVYFEDGAAVFATSNIRAHRLSEFLKRSGVIDDATPENLPPKADDEELLGHLVKQGRIKPGQVNKIRTNHVTDVLRAALLWTEGEWQFDRRVRIAGEARVTLDTQRLLLESARHLPESCVASRFSDENEQLEVIQNNGYSAQLSPTEGFVLSRLTEPMTVKELVNLTGLGEAETLRAVYGLAMSGLLQRSGWARGQPSAKAGESSARKSGAVHETGVESVEDFLLRIEKASEPCDVLGVGRHATPDEVKNAYHRLARRYHPDRFHQADAVLRGKIDSAFARIARAYEILAEQSARASFDDRSYANGGAAKSSAPSAAPRSQTSPTESAAERAAASFQKGLAAMKLNQQQQALRFFAEAANLEPRHGRYRAEYGRALINDPQTRRIAEIELKAAIALEPNNVSYRVILAELYKALGLRKRAEGELQRALTADPKNQAARALLSSFKK